MKYDHTPIHKTVAELSELFKPPPRELGPGAQKLLQQKTPKKKTPKEKKTPKTKTPRKKPEKRAQDEMSGTRKRKKKKKDDSQATALVAVMSEVTDVAAAAVLQLGQNSTLANGEQGTQGRNDNPQGLVGDSSKNQLGTRAGTQLPLGITFPVYITQAEANRRRDAAMTMLSNAGVPPDSLSVEQFSTFSNQTPEFQKESLNMLVKYGAERLCIVHPSAKDGAAQANASTTGQNGQATTSKELVPQSGGFSNEGTAPLATEEPSPKTRKRKKPGKSQTACFQCKKHKTKVCTMTTVCTRLTVGVPKRTPYLQRMRGSG